MLTSVTGVKSLRKVVRVRRMHMAATVPRSLWTTYLLAAQPDIYELPAITLTQHPAW